MTNNKDLDLLSSEELQEMLDRWDPDFIVRQGCQHDEMDVVSHDGSFEVIQKQLLSSNPYNDYTTKIVVFEFDASAWPLSDSGESNIIKSEEDEMSDLSDSVASFLSYDKDDLEFPRFSFFTFSKGSLCSMDDGSTLLGYSTQILLQQ